MNLMMSRLKFLYFLSNSKVKITKTNSEHIEIIQSNYSIILYDEIFKLLLLFYYVVKMNKELIGHTSESNFKNQRRV